MKNTWTIFLFLLLSWSLQAQWNADQKAVLKTVDDFFSALHAGDSAALRPLMHQEARMRSLVAGALKETPLETFFMAVGMKPRPNQWKEELWSYRVQVDGPMASVWTDYSFFLDEQLSHCGVNQFVLLQSANSWKILEIIDTRRNSGCLLESREAAARKAIDTLMTQWHQAATDADADAFYGKMTKDGIYIGTDISERWLRDELRSWAKAAFDKAPAWDFKAKDRSIYFDANEPDIAWLEESLDTWMGPCRGSAVLRCINGTWKIKHYHLAVAVPNDAIDAYLKIIGRKRPKKKR